MKFCRDCKYCIVGENERQYMCKHEKNVKYSLVTGDPIYTFSCYSLRDGDTFCGVTGKWFEEKEEKNA